jgi:NAD(P)-dependent dehydrogenase (short-subunit alcohol dehydrogenase family)
VETLALPAEPSEEDLQARFAAVAAPVAVFLHLHPPVAAEGVTGITEVDIALVRRVFLSARALKEPLCTASELGFAAFVAVVRLDGSLGLGGGEFATAGGGLFGLVKTLGIEWPGVFCRGIDLAPDLEVDAAAERLLAELADPNRLVVEVGLSRAGRLTLDAVLQEVAIPEIAEHSLLVLSGGGRGITARCATRLAERYRCRFLLLGRSAAMVAEPPGAETVVGEAELKRLIYDDLQHQEEKPAPAAVSARYEAIRAAREIRATLEAIRAAGGTAEYLQVDIADREALATALPPVLERLGPVSGIVHGAGNLADRRIERKSAADFEWVFAPKVRGLANLLACLPTDQLRHLVLFSSVVGFYGNVGQTDYAMANEVLNKVAHRLTRQLPNCRTVAIGWGPWEAGMVSAELKAFFQTHGVETIPAEQGADLLLAELGAHETQVILGSALPRPLGALPPGERVIRRLSLAANPFLADHVIQGNPVLPATCALVWLANTCEQLYPGYRFHTAEHYRVLKGIVFDANCPEEFTVEVTREAGEAERLVCEAKVLSTTPDGRTRYHYSARLTLVGTVPASPRDPALALSVEAGAAITATLYQSGEGSLFHGPTFQGVRRILAFTPEQIVLECVLPPLDARVQGQFPVQAFDPYAADIEIHSTWLWLERTHGQICLPTAIERFEQFTLIPPGAVFYVSMRLRARTETSITVDVLAHDADGHLYSRMLAAQGTVLVRRQLVH